MGYMNVPSSGGGGTVDTSSVTAAGALMDSEVTNLAQVKAFDPADYLQTKSSVRYGLTSNKTLSSGVRYTFTSGDFTAYDADTNAVTFSGTSITLKGAGVFNVNLYGYFAAAANLAVLGAQAINPPGDPGATQIAINNIQAKLDAFIENELEFDLSIGDSNASNKYAYNRNIINMGDSVVRFSQFATATIETTGDTVINLSGYTVWPQTPSLIGTGSSDPIANNNPQYTGFTITKVA